MHPLSRRELLAVVGAAALPVPAARAQLPASVYDEAYAILYDATRCIGCRACARRCRRVKATLPDVGEIDGIRFDQPRDLSHRNLTVIQLCDGGPAPPPSAPGARRWSFLKRNCMHCNAPACVSACPVAALRKTDRGPVVYYEERCIGCRYCMLACPYNVPRYEWLDRAPRVRKCDLNGGCVQACPVGALVDGTRKGLIAEAHRRIEREPRRYLDHVYGEFEGGGTSYLILSAIPLERFGLPRLPPTAPGSYAEPILGAVPGWVAGLALFLGALHRLQKRPSGVEGAVREGEP
ncbi:MAG: NAD(P)H-quinone oxidoreductase subunit I, chloroplastic [Phycisphaerae bacterium]|nr:NAD(P)H-quinone oxidoreductase subunit I, chloroplastic [Phycisphaerae bacterium]